jgi:hypothetical protein
MTGFPKDGNLPPLLSHAAALYHSYLRRFAEKINDLTKESAIFSKVKHELMIESHTGAGRYITETSIDARLHQGAWALLARWPSPWAGDDPSHGLMAAPGSRTVAGAHAP